MDTLARRLLAEIAGVPLDDEPTPTASGEAAVGVGQASGDLTEMQTGALQGAVRPYVGTRYALGGNDPAKGIDCSGLVNSILRGFGAQLPGRPTTTTYRTQLASPTTWDNIRPGDILLSAANPRDPTSGEHMAIYVGAGQMAEATADTRRGQPGVRIVSVEGTSLTPYRMREPVPGLQDATRLAQITATQSGGDTARVTPTSANNPLRLQGAQQGQPQGDQGQRGLVQLALDHGAPPELAQIMAVGALMESGGNPQSSGDGGHSQGLYHMHDGGAGAGMSVEARRDPDNATRVMLRNEYQPHYDRLRGQGLQGQDLARAVYLAAERPDMRDPRVQAHVQNDLPRHYQNVTSLAQQGRDVAVGGAGIVPLQGGQQQRGTVAPPNIPQQALEALRQLVAPGTAHAQGSPMDYERQAAAASAAAPPPAAEPPRAPLGIPNPADPGNPIYQATVGPGERVPPAPASADAGEAPPSMPSPAPPPAMPVQPQNTERAVAFGYTPPRAAATTAPPATIASDPRANVPAREPRPGYHFEPGALGGPPEEKPDPGYHPEYGMVWNGQTWQQVSAASQRSNEPHVVPLPGGGSLMTGPNGENPRVYFPRNDGSVISAPVGPDGAPLNDQWAQVQGADATLSADQQASRDYQNRALQQARDIAQMPYNQMTAEQRANQGYQQQALNQAWSIARMPYEGMTAEQQAQRDYQQQALQQASDIAGRPYEQMTAEQLASRDYQDRALSQAASIAARPYAEMTAEQQANRDYQDRALSQAAEIAARPYTDLTAEQKASQEERRYEFGTLSANQQAQLGVEQQQLQQRHEETMLPYERMTVAQQAQNRVAEEQVGLQRQELAATPTQLPRGGVGVLNRLTGGFSIANPPEPEEVRQIGGNVYVPAGRSLSMASGPSGGTVNVSGGPDPYRGGSMFGGGAFGGQGLSYGYGGGYGASMGLGAASGGIPGGGGNAAGWSPMGSAPQRGWAPPVRMPQWPSPYGY